MIIVENFSLFSYLERNPNSAEICFHRKPRNSKQWRHSDTNLGKREQINGSKISYNFIPLIDDSRS